MSHDVFYLPFITLSSMLIATLSSLKKKRKKERCDFITKHLTDFAMLYVSSLVFNHVRQIQNKAELKIIKMMNT